MRSPAAATYHALKAVMSPNAPPATGIMGMEGMYSPMVRSMKVTAGQVVSE